MSSRRKPGLGTSPQVGRRTSCFLGETPPGRRGQSMGYLQPGLVRVPCIPCLAQLFPRLNSGLTEVLYPLFTRADCSSSLAGGLRQRVGWGTLEMWLIPPWVPRLLPALPPPPPPLGHFVITAGLAVVHRPQARLPGGLKPDLIKM